MLNDHGPRVESIASDKSERERADISEHEDRTRQAIEDALNGVEAAPEQS